jgi:hypothetical protein
MQAGGAAMRADVRNGIAPLGRSVPAPGRADE